VRESRTAFQRALVLGPAAFDDSVGGRGCLASSASPYKDRQGEAIERVREQLFDESVGAAKAATWQGGPRRRGRVGLIFRAHKALTR